jgi:hypothetical protein
MKNKDADFIQRLGRSELYSEFKQALGASTGLPLTLRPVEFCSRRTAVSPMRTLSAP